MKNSYKNKRLKYSLSEMNEQFLLPIPYKENLSTTFNSLLNSFFPRLEHWGRASWGTLTTKLEVALCFLSGHLPRRLCCMSKRILGRLSRAVGLTPRF